eukprot:s3618_g5.t1
MPCHSLKVAGYCWFCTGKLDGGKSRESSCSARSASPKSPKSPKSRPRGSLLSLGDADVHLSFRVNGLDDIIAEHAMTTEYEEALKRVIVQQAGAGLQTKHLQLKSSGAKVNAKISLSWHGLRCWYGRTSFWYPDQAAWML